MGKNRRMEWTLVDIRGQLIVLGGVAALALVPGGAVWHVVLFALVSMLDTSTM